MGVSTSFELSYLTDNGPVAQLDRASVFGTEGWGFDSLRGRQIRTALSSALRSDHPPPPPPPFLPIDPPHPPYPNTPQKPLNSPSLRESSDTQNSYENAR